MKRERHPYESYVPEDATCLILGSIPPWRFTVHPNEHKDEGKLLQPGDIDFYYGSNKNYFWKIFEKIYATKLKTSEEIKSLLSGHKIAISDIVKKCYRKQNKEGPSSQDADLYNIEYNRDAVLDILNKNNIHTILFTSKYVENGFYHSLHSQIRGWHQLTTQPSTRDMAFQKKDSIHTIRTITLYSPSPAANRSIGKEPEYKMKRKADKRFSTLDFRIEQYRRFLPQI